MITGYSIVIGILWVVLVIYTVISFKTIRLVSVQSPIETQPAVAIIIAVRNEEQDLEKALESVCNLNYNNYQIIVVNDRSTDGTAAILGRVSKQYPRITIITIDTLPYGWLGKNNALYQGYKYSTEEWLLFTDADIEFHPDTLLKALGYADKNNLDHLTILPDVVSKSTTLNSVLGTFSLIFILYTRPWDAKNSRSKASIGIGAFNLVKRSAYEKAGTHLQIRLRPDDDLKLGQKIKQAGLRQDILNGNNYICLEWYKNLGQFCNGLLKNSFATADYSIVKAIINVIGILILVALPIPIMLIWGSGVDRIIAGIVIVAQMIYMSLIRRNKWWYAFMIPFAGLVMTYVTISSAWLTLKQGGIYWRDSFYPLAMLKGKE